MPNLLSRRRFFTFDFSDRQAGGDHWIHVHRMAMACRFEVRLSSEDAGDIAAARAALDEACHIDAALTAFRDTRAGADPDRRAGAEAAVDNRDDHLVALLARCRDLHASMEGAIEVNVGAAGRGYALDRMAALMRARGAGHALLSAGRSSVVAIGGRGRGWVVGLRPHLASRCVGRLWIRDGAVSTSGTGDGCVAADGSRCSHQVDPGAGRPPAAVAAASVVTRHAASADALSTAFLVGGPDLARRYCAAHPETLAVLVRDDQTDIFGRYSGATVEVPE